MAPSLPVLTWNPVATAFRERRDAFAAGDERRRDGMQFSESVRIRASNPRANQGNARPRFDLEERGRRSPSACASATPNPSPATGGDAREVGGLLPLRSQTSPPGAREARVWSPSQLAERSLHHREADIQELERLPSARRSRRLLRNRAERNRGRRAA